MIDIDLETVAGFRHALKNFIAINFAIAILIPILAMYYDAFKNENK